jgi:hypothetical protein
VILGTGCLGPRALDGPAILEALAATGLARVLLVAPEGAEPAGLQGAPASAVRAAWKERAAGLAAARASRCPRVVLELPADAELEPACRALHAFGRSEAGLVLAVTTPKEGPLADPAALALLLEDLSSQRTGYWHTPSAALLGGRTDTDWIDVLGRHLVGMSLDDVADGEAGLPPGLGTLDFGAVAEHAATSVDVALDVAPVQDVALLRFTLDQLRQAGFS